MCGPHVILPSFYCVQFISFLFDFVTRLHFSHDRSNSVPSANTENSHCHYDGRETGQCLEYDKGPLMSAATTFTIPDVLLLLHLFHHE
jgi:hypothetical protein